MVSAFDVFLNHLYFLLEFFMVLFLHLNGNSSGTYLGIWFEEEIKSTSCQMDSQIAQHNLLNKLFFPQWFMMLTLFYSKYTCMVSVLKCYSVLFYYYTL